jgi:hypothetical protein
MRNPNNELIPNLWDETQAGAKSWVNTCKSTGVYKYMNDPMSFIDSKLTQAEAKYLCHLKAKAERLLGHEVGISESDILEKAREYGYQNWFPHRDSVDVAWEYAMNSIDLMHKDDRLQAITAMAWLSNTHAYLRAKAELEGGA